MNDKQVKVLIGAVVGGLIGTFIHFLGAQTVLAIQDTFDQIEIGLGGNGAQTTSSSYNSAFILLAMIPGLIIGLVVGALVGAEKGRLALALVVLGSVLGNILLGAGFWMVSLIGGLISILAALLARWLLNKSMQQKNEVSAE